MGRLSMMLLWVCAVGCSSNETNPPNGGARSQTCDGTKRTHKGYEEVHKMSLDLRALNEGHDRSYGVVLLNWVTVWDSGCPETVELCSEVRSAPAVIAIDVHLRKKFFEPLANSERCNIPMIELDIDMVAPREGRFNPPRARAHWDLLATHPGLEAQQVGFSPPWHGRVLELYPSNAHQAN